MNEKELQEMRDNVSKYKKCSISVSIVDNREFVFLVPSHLVDKEGNVDNEILYEIEGQFHDGALDHQDIEESGYDNSLVGHEYMTTDMTKYSTNPSVKVEDGECTVFDESEENLLIFGN